MKIVTMFIMTKKWTKNFLTKEGCGKKRNKLLSFSVVSKLISLKMSINDYHLTILTNLHDNLTSVTKKLIEQKLFFVFSL